jgi:catechol 2,3-dioxygenase-like lactoylglutathione lyase family enzyme
MIGYVCIGTNDLAKAGRFYDEVLAPLGAKRSWETERMIGWGTSADAPSLLLIMPHDRQPATVGNGSMVALAGGSRAGVDAVYHKAIALGAKDEGPLGDRGGNFYAGYFRDLEGNKLAVFHVG